VGKGAEAVVLQLEDPAAIVERLAALHQRHRTNVGSFGDGMAKRRG
jgi:hypothetical protein